MGPKPTDFVPITCNIFFLIDVLKKAGERSGDRNEKQHSRIQWYRLSPCNLNITIPDHTFRASESKAARSLEERRESLSPLIGKSKKFSLYFELRLS